jgi:anti-sigma factor RsiW
MSESESKSIDDAAHEQLVAYLDGELDADASKRVERQLAENADYRRELQQLQRAWDMLDELPRVEVGDSFTRTTVEIVALSAAQELTQTQGRTLRRERLIWAVAGAGLAVAALASYLALSAYFARRNTQLVRDLLVIENIDLDEVADSVEFLHQLRDADVFDEEADNGR